MLIFYYIFIFFISIFKKTEFKKNNKNIPDYCNNGEKPLIYSFTMYSLGTYYLPRTADAMAYSLNSEISNLT
jgi:hypothetical protein